MLPELEKGRVLRQVQGSFAGGLWHRQHLASNTYFDGENYTASHYPALASRLPRRIWQMLSEGAQGMYAASALYLISQGELLVARNYLHTESLGKLTDTPKVLGALGNQLLILPDFAILDTVTQTLDKRKVVMNMGQVYVRNQDYLDEDGIAKAIKLNTLHCNDYIFTDYFKPGDSVLLQGTMYNDGAYTIRAVGEFDLRFDENSFVPEDILGCTLTNRPPEMGQLCACGGRLWGFAGSRIYASAPGQPDNWYRYDGDGQSSYTVDVPDGGDFTACISHGGHPVFFKSGCMVEIFGDSPENFAVSTVQLAGVKRDSAHSVCSVGGELLYLSDCGVVRCSGSGTQLLSQPLGTALSEGFATTDGRSYYLCARGEDGVRRLYVFDTCYRIWHVQDGTDLSAMVAMDGEIYAYAQNGTVYLLADSNTQKGIASETVSSHVTLDPLEDAARGQIVPVRLGLRVWCSAGSRLSLYVSYDGGEWQKRADLQADGERMWYVPLSPQSCFSLGVRIEGVGQYCLRSVVREYR